MRKIILMILSIVMIVLFVGCNTMKSNSSNDKNLVNDLTVKVERLEEKIDKLENDLEIEDTNTLKLMNNESTLRDDEYKVQDRHYHYMEVLEDKIYIIYQRENPDDPNDWSDALWCFSPIGANNKLFEGKGIDFRVSPDNKHIAIKCDETLSIIDTEGNLEKEFTLADLNIGEYSHMSLMKWDDSGDKLWLESMEAYVTETYIKIDVNTWNIDIYPNEFVFTDDLDFNPNIGWIVCSDYPVFLDVVGLEQYKESGDATTLYLYNIETQDRMILDTQITNKFYPKWISNEEINYTYMDKIKDYTFLLEELRDKVSVLDYDITKDNLSTEWSVIWDETFKNEGTLDKNQVNKINYLLKTVLDYNDPIDINPISCFFTSYYEDIRDINLTDFLRYFPNGEVPDLLPEFEELRSLENWPFEYAKSLNDVNVPIHRYQRDVVQNIFDDYAGINLNELTGVGSDEVLYLKSTDAYYNYTSDFGPSTFTCNNGTVEEGVLTLYGDVRNDNHPVLTIVKSEDKYVIQSFNVLNN